VIQLEGSKHWLLYEPLAQLPNTYSEDMEIKDLKEPICDVILNVIVEFFFLKFKIKYLMKKLVWLLKQGDILYFPRGFIHQANTPANDTNMHSTHITISTYQD
jgi:ribosomal protein L16 Arg81 hydroxylase